MERDVFNRPHFRDAPRPGPTRSSWRHDFGTRFGHDFSQVRIHADTSAARLTRSLGAKAATIGPDIYFGAGRFSPETPTGRRLLAHELSHAIQQGATKPTRPDSVRLSQAPAGLVQRDIDEAELPRTPVEQIMADPSYFERGIASIEYYSAELAILHYDDGSQIRLGLVPDEISAPFEAVDYRTPRSVHLPVTSQAGSMGTGSILFIPRGTEATFPEGTTFGDIPRIAEEAGRRIRFTHHNGHIVPTEVNTLSAPRLCEALRNAEAEFVRRFDESAEATVEVLETLEWVILLYSIYGGLVAGGARTAATRGAASGGARAATSIFGRAQQALARFFARLLRTGATSEITVEGVGFGGVQATMQGTELVIARSTIINASGAAGRGRLVHAAFEQAAIQTARANGAQTARVALHLVQNPRWAAYLESQGYAFELLATETGFSNVLTKVFIL